MENKVTSYMRNTLNEYYQSRSSMSKEEFCKSKRITKKTLDYYIQLSGQHLMGPLADLAERNLNIYYGKIKGNVEDLKRECSKIIAIEISDEEAKKKRKGEVSSFEYLRYKLLVDIAMAPESYDILEVFYRMEKDLLHVYPY